VSTDPLIERSRKDGPRRALVDAGAGFWISWVELDGLATAWARRLQRLGVQPGDRVAVREPAGARFAALLFACLRQGYAFVPLPMGAPQPEIERLLADCGPRVLVEDAEPGLRHGATTGAEGDACIVYTSGTTGPPKGVRLTAANLLASAEGCQESLASTPDDRWLLCLAPHHVGGLAILIRAAVSNQPVTVLGRFEEQRVLEALGRENCTLLSLVPTMLVRLLDAGGLEPLTRVRAILLGGAPAPPDQVRAWARLGLQVCPTYGLSETGSQVATVPPGAAEELAGTAGFAHSRATLEVVDGEIVVGGPVLSPGYVNPEVRPAPEAGRFRTGDGGRIRAEGALEVTGRLDDVIITGGENVQPLEVEEVLRAHPAVRDAAVVGVPDRTWGQVLEARVVGEGAGGDELAAFARERLAGFKVPRRFVFVDRLPRSEGGKLLRRQLTERDGA
jgi:o-succinylbenzoate---CoA ligase